MDKLITYFNNFNPLPKESISAISDICKPISIVKNRELQPIGHTCKTLYFLCEGAARIYYYKDEIDVTEYFYFENSMLARAESLFTNRPSRKAIQIIEDSQLIAIDAPKLLKLYDTHPPIERLFRKIFELAYVETINRVESIQFHSAEERYQALLTQAPNIIQRIPLKYIASYLGITQVSLSRIRANMK